MNLFTQWRSDKFEGTLLHEPAVVAALRLCSVAYIFGRVTD